MLNAMAQAVLLGSIMVTIAIVGITMNTLAVCIFETRKKMKSLFHRILMCLLLADNLYLACTILSSVYFDFDIDDIVWIMPYFVLPFKDVSRTACLLTTIALSYERYSICCDPKKIKRSSQTSMSGNYNKYKIYVIILSVWVISVVYNILRFFVYSIDSRDPEVYSLQKTKLRENSDFKLYYKGIRWIIFTLMSLATLIFLNWKVYTHVTQSLRDCGRKSSATINEDNTPRPSFHEEYNYRMSKQLLGIIRRREKLVFALFVLVLCNLIGNSLKMVEETIQAIGIKPDGLRTLQKIARLMLTLNSSVNAIIYGFSDRKFRRIIFSIMMNAINFTSCNTFFTNEKQTSISSHSDQKFQEIQY